MHFLRLIHCSKQDQNQYNNEYICLIIDIISFGIYNNIDNNLKYPLINNSILFPLFKPFDDNDSSINIARAVMVVVDS